MVVCCNVLKHQRCGPTLREPWRWWSMWMIWSWQERTKSWRRSRPSCRNASSWLWRAPTTELLQEEDWDCGRCHQSPCEREVQYIWGPGKFVSQREASKDPRISHHRQHPFERRGRDPELPQCSWDFTLCLWFSARHAVLHQGASSKASGSNPWSHEQFAQSHWLHGHNHGHSCGDGRNRPEQELSTQSWWFDYSPYLFGERGHLAVRSCNRQRLERP